MAALQAAPALPRSARASCPRPPRDKHTLRAGAPSAGGRCRGAETRAATAAEPRHGNAKRPATRPRQGLRRMRGRATGHGRLTNAHRARVGSPRHGVCAPAPEHPRVGGRAGRATPHTASALGRCAGAARAGHALGRCPDAAHD